MGFPRLKFGGLFYLVFSSMPEIRSMVNTGLRYLHVPIQKFHNVRLFVKGARVMLTSGFAYKNMLLLHHSMTSKNCEVKQI